MTMMKSCFITLAILFLWRLEEGAEACSCGTSHLQQHFCYSNVVITATVIGRQETISDTFHEVKYNIKVTKVFKGPNRHIDAVYTSGSSAECGVSLSPGEQYLLTGRLEYDGTVHIGLCDFTEEWNALNAAQKMNLMLYYESGCVCEIKHCSSIMCSSNSPEVCHWNRNNQQFKDYACIKRHGSCTWHKGSAPPTTS